MPSSYQMPAEWEKQQAIWLAWPHNREDWPGYFRPIPGVFAGIIAHIAASQQVNLLVKNQAAYDKVSATLTKKLGRDMKRVKLFIIPTNRVWLRDSGPIFVRDTTGEKIMLDFQFNAWAKYPDHKLDDAVPEQIGKHLPPPRIRPLHKGRRIVLEGGSIDVNGKGSILTTEECLLSKIQERNPDFKRGDYEEIFARYLGAPNVIWLDKGIAGDDTHGHVDDLARFIDPATVAIVVEHSKRDKNYALLKDNVKRLNRARDQDGKQLTVIELPMPKPVITERQRLPASYANFLITNNTVLVPTFEDKKNDALALEILAQHFRSRNVISIPSRDLVWGLGTLHCMSQQEPL